MKAFDIIDCSCDACGKDATCSPTEPAPRGWFYVASPAGKNDGGSLACSKKCLEQLSWKRHRGPR